MNAPGVVYLVGAGPWAPGLLTLRGAQVLGRADVVVYDYLANPELLRHCPRAETILVGEGPHRKTQAEINDLLVELGLAGRVVVRLKGGDPFVFGRGGEEAEALAGAGVPFEVVPGVTAAIAGAAYAGIPVTHRGFGPTLTLVTGHGKADQDPIAGVDWAAVARMSTVALYMAARNLPAIASALMAAGRSPETPVAMVRWATRVDQQTLVSTLGEAAADAERAGLAAPMTVVVGEVVRLRETIRWFERRALHGLRIVVTRSAGQSGPFVERLDDLGAECILLPTIEFAPPRDAAPLTEALGRLDTYDWVIFTSANGVDFALDALRAAGRDARAFGRARIACIGPATARRLAERGLLADRVPETFVAEALLEQFVAEGITGRRYLLLRAEVAREILPDALRAGGGAVDVVVAYRTQAAVVEPAALARIRRGEVDVLTFTASSTVRHFCDLVGPEAVAALQARVPALCIGPVTAETARDAGFRVAATAESFTIPGLVDALVAWRGGGAN
jgi:uroporphyrinogen III methyltransferase/synthase